MMQDGLDSTSPHLPSSCLGRLLLSSKTDMPSPKAWLHPDSDICFQTNPDMWTRRNAASRYWKFSARIGEKQNNLREWRDCKVSKETAETETNFCEAATTTASQACLHKQWNQSKQDWTPGATNNPHFKTVATRSKCPSFSWKRKWGGRPSPKPLPCLSNPTSAKELDWQQLPNSPTQLLVRTRAASNLRSSSYCSRLQPAGYLLCMLAFGGKTFDVICHNFPYTFFCPSGFGAGQHVTCGNKT